MSLSIESAVEADIDWNVTLLGRATVVDDGERLDWAQSWIYDAYEDEPSTGGEADPELKTDGG